MGRNKLVMAEQRVIASAAKVQHSVDNFEYVRRGSLKALQSQEMERVRLTKATYLQFTETLRADTSPFKLQNTAQFEQFESAVKELSAKQEFVRFVDRAKRDATARFVAHNEKALNISAMLRPWRTSRHFFEDAMHIQMTQFNIDRKTLSVPFVFEFLMEHFETESALRDPDLFMTNPVAPSMADQARTFTFDTAMHPETIHSVIADDVKEATKDEHSEARMHVGDVMALAVLFARLVNVLKKAMRAQRAQGNGMALIDLSYEVSHCVMRCPRLSSDAEWNVLNAEQMEHGALEVILDPQSTYTAPLPPSHRQKRAEMAFVTYLLSNAVPVLNDVKVVNTGQKLRERFMPKKN